MRPRAKHLSGECAGGFALGEVLVAIFILSMVFSGLIYGYVQANRMSEWSAMSLAAQSYASQGAEQARAADWRPRDWPQTNGPNTMDELPPTNYTTVDIMDIPIQGDPAASNFSFWVTNYISVTTYSANPPMRQIKSDCRWIFPLTGQLQTNTVILIRGPDQ
jgi:Tfp pilus assembly protein PilV